MADLGEYVSSTLIYILPLLLSKNAINLGFSKLNNLFIGISMHAGLKRSNCKVSIIYECFLCMTNSGHTFPDIRARTARYQAMGNSGHRCVYVKSMID